MATKKPIPSAHRIAVLDSRALAILSPASRGCGLNPSMRLVALLMILWAEDWDRMNWTADMIADRTGISEARVLDALDKLQTIKFLRQTASGWKLTYEDFEKHTIPAWRVRSLLLDTHKTKTGE